MLDGRRQLSTGGTSRMTRERPVRFCEGLGVKFPGPTRRWPREGRLGRRGGGEIFRGVRHTSTARTSLMRPRATSWA